MKPLALLAGGLSAACAMGIAHGQTLTSQPATAMLQPPLTLPTSGSTVERDQRSFAANGALVRQSVTEVRTATESGAVSTLRMTAAESSVTPAGFASPLTPSAQIRDRAYDIDYTRTWPSALSATAGGYALSLSPETSVGYGTAGGSVGGGATLEVSSARGDAAAVDKLSKMGVKDGERFGDQGRFYLFAAAKGRAVGMNLVRTDDGLARQGLSTDPAALVGDAQIGVGWRKGDMQTSLGYTVRRVRVQDAYAQTAIDYPKSDQVVGLSFSYKPKR